VQSKIVFTVPLRILLELRTMLIMLEWLFNLLRAKLMFIVR